MAWLQILLHSFLSLVLLHHSLIATSSGSFSTLCNHSDRGLPLRRLPLIPPFNTWLVGLLLSILATSARHLIRFALTAFVICGSPYVSLSSSCVPLLQMPFQTFPMKVFSFLFNFYASLRQITTGLIILLYIFFSHFAKYFLTVRCNNTPIHFMPLAILSCVSTFCFPLLVIVIYR